VIGVCRDYLKAHLEGIGIARVLTRPEDAGKHQVAPYAVIVPGEETLVRDGTLVACADGPGAGERTFRRRLHRRTVTFRVKIVQRDPGAVDAAAAAFLGGLARRILDPAGNAILVAARGAEPEEETSVLRDQEAVHFLVAFEGGVYADRAVKVYPASALAVEVEMAKEV
jgi:hypothetical protein